MASPNDDEIRALAGRVATRLLGAGPQPRRRRVLHRRLGGQGLHRPAGQQRVVPRRRGGVFERGQGRAARGRRGHAPPGGRGERGRRPRDGGRGARPVRRRRSDRRERDCGPGRRRSRGSRSARSGSPGPSTATTSARSARRSGASRATGRPCDARPWPGPWRACSTRDATAGGRRRGASPRGGSSSRSGRTTRRGAASPRSCAISCPGGRAAAAARPMARDARIPGRRPGIEAAGRARRGRSGEPAARAACRARVRPARALEAPAGAVPGGRGRCRSRWPRSCSRCARSCCCAASAGGAALQAARDARAQGRAAAAAGGRSSRCTGRRASSRWWSR